MMGACFSKKIVQNRSTDVSEVTEITESEDSLMVYSVANKQEKPLEQSVVFPREPRVEVTEDSGCQLSSFGSTRHDTNPVKDGRKEDKSWRSSRLIDFIFLIIDEEGFLIY